MEYLQYSQGCSRKAHSLRVLNLVINGIPSILERHSRRLSGREVLNLVINGIPSILVKKAIFKHIGFFRF